MFGPRQDPQSAYAAVIPRFITDLLADRSPMVFGDGEQTRDFTYVDNVVNANLLAAEAEGVAGKAYNVATGERSSLNDLVQRLQELTGSTAAASYEPPRPGDVRDSLADVSLAQAELGYRPDIGFDEGLRLSVEFHTRRGASRATVSAGRTVARFRQEASLRCGNGSELMGAVADA